MSSCFLKNKHGLAAISSHLYTLCEYLVVLKSVVNQGVLFLEEGLSQWLTIYLLMAGYPVTLFCLRNTLWAHVWMVWTRHLRFVFSKSFMAPLFFPLTVRITWHLSFLAFLFYKYFFTKIHCDDHFLRSRNPSWTKQSRNLVEFIINPTCCRT